MSSLKIAKICVHNSSILGSGSMVLSRDPPMIFFFYIISHSLARNKHIPHCLGRPINSFCTVFPFKEDVSVEIQARCTPEDNPRVDMLASRLIVGDHFQQPPKTSKCDMHADCYDHTLRKVKPPVKKV